MTNSPHSTEEILGTLLEATATVTGTPAKALLSRTRFQPIATHRLLFVHIALSADISAKAVAGFTSRGLSNVYKGYHRIRQEMSLGDRRAAHLKELAGRILKHVDL